MKKTVLSLLLLAFVVTAAGCETLKGAAKDIENTGRNIGEVFSGEAFE